jgi:hypothetical protein
MIAFRSSPLATSAKYLNEKIESLLELKCSPVVVTLHFEVEDFGLASRRLGDKMSVQQIKNDLADVAELDLDLLSIFLSNGL